MYMPCMHFSLHFSLPCCHLVVSKGLLGGLQLELSGQPMHHCKIHQLKLSFMLDTQDKNGKETNGFKSRMGSRAPAPRLLRLKPEDQPLLLGSPLRQGKFTWVTEAGREERWVVASCGNYTVLWNFRYSSKFHPRASTASAAHELTIIRLLLLS